MVRAASATRTRVLLGEPTADSNSINEQAASNQRELSGADKCRAYRQQQKAKREELRRQEIELSHELIQLQQADRMERARLDARREPSYFVGRDRATRLQKERERAEAQQQELRGTVRSQELYIEMMRGLLVSSLRQMDSIDFVEAGCRRKKQRLQDGPFDGFIRELDTKFSRTDEAFRAFAVLALNQTEPVVQATRKSGTDDVVEYFYPQSNIVHVLPFSLRETGSCLWELGEQRYCNRPAFERYLNVEDPNNTIVVRFVDRSVLKTGTIGQMQQQFIARRFVEDDRIVIIWKFISEGDGVFSGMKVDEMGWCRLLPSTDVAEPGTVVEMWTRRVPMQFRDLPSRESAMDEFHDVLQANSEETLDDVVASLVNVAL